MRHNCRYYWNADLRSSRCERRATKRVRRSEALLEEGALNSAPEKVRDAKFGSSEFFDPHDIVQVKYEMLRRVTVEKASVVSATEEYGVSRPTYYQTKTSFEEAGIAGLVPRKRGPHGPHKLQGACWRLFKSNWWRASPFERASWPGKSRRNSTSMSTRGRSSGRSG